MRRTIGRRFGAAGLLASLGLAATALAGDAAVDRVVSVQAVRPDRQAEAVIELFRGSRAESPAAAMASWRRATGDPNGLNKAVQAVAALFNPETAREWRAFDGAGLAAGLDADGRLRWSAAVPRDDGSVAALVTSMRLSGGSDEPPTPEGWPVRRLGGPDAALAAVTPSGVAFAGRRPELEATVARLTAPRALEGRALSQASGDGFHVTFLPAALPAEVPADWARPIAAVRASGLRLATGVLGLRDDRLDLDLGSDFDPAKAALLDVPPVDAAWLAWMPADATRAAVALSAGRGPAFWDALFDLADRVDRADPARAQLQPLRARLNLLALVRGVRPEADLWPLVRGVAAGAFDDGGAVVAIVAGTPEDADRIARRVVLPLAPLLGGKPAAAAPGEVVAIGRASGKPVETAVRGATVLIGWGEGSLGRALKSAEAPEQSVAPLVAAEGRPAGRVGAFRPGLLPLPASIGRAGPLAATLAEAAPAVWRGGWDDGRAWDVVRWGDLRRVVARFLERVPQAPPEAP
ncbi:MAG: hypothetical protein BGO49_08165 [Planctomycetales bacterium 71-10]|nr:MAG: hypothetical protein BGO49_08165 [Planctomycetales bacterium 71-10]